MTIEEINAARIFVLQHAIGALIVTHPAPEKFAESFGLLVGMQQLGHIANAGSSDSVRAVSLEFSQELIELANDEVQRRAGKLP